MSARFSLSLIPIIFLSFLLGCARSHFPDTVDIGQRLILTDGTPEFTLSADGNYTEAGEPYITVTVSLAKSSLVFVTRDGIPSARIEARFEIIPDEETQRAGQSTYTRTSTHVIEGDPELTVQRAERIRYEETFYVKPGFYTITLSIRDEASGQRLTRSVIAELPDLDDESGLLTGISVFGNSQDDEGSVSIATYDIPSAFESLTFRFFITRSEDDPPIYAHMRLLEFESDQQPARHMSFRNLPANSIRIRGINYGQSEVLEEQTRLFADEFGAIEVEFTIPPPHIGSFRFEIFTSKNGTANPADAIVFRARDFGMRSPHFPEISSAREMAEPLIYLMNDREHRELMAIEDDAELRRAVERFWLENLGSADVAREVMQLFYERVVEANKQFSNHKSGWKTDLGMIYILFGPPWYEEQFGRELRWIYGFDRNDPFRVFVFDLSRLGNDRFPFNSWTLIRRDFYHSIHFHRTQEWLNGFVLRRPFGS